MEMVEEGIWYVCFAIKLTFILREFALKQSFFLFLSANKYFYWFVCKKKLLCYFNPWTDVLLFILLVTTAALANHLTNICRVFSNYCSLKSICWILKMLYSICKNIVVVSIFHFHQQRCITCKIESRCFIDQWEESTKIIWLALLEHRDIYFLATRVNFQVHVTKYLCGM